MLNKFLHCNIKTPDGLLYSGEAVFVRIYTDMGAIEIHPNHANLVTTVTFSRIVIQKENGRSYVLARNGFVEFSTDSNTLNGYFLDGEKGGSVKYESIEDYRKRVLQDLHSKDDKNHKYSIRFLKKEALALDKMLSIEEE
jgi:F0F1-type ATP synthase epsilon subunit